MNYTTQVASLREVRQIVATLFTEVLQKTSNNDNVDSPRNEADLVSGTIGNNDYDGKVDRRVPRGKSLTRKDIHPTHRTTRPNLHIRGRVMHVASLVRKRNLRIHQMTYRHPALILLATTIRAPVRIIALHPPIRNIGRRNVNVIDASRDQNG